MWEYGPKYDQPSEVKRLEKYIEEVLMKEEETKERIIERARYAFYMSLTAKKIVEVVNRMVK